jgi:hypothetical protein
MNKKSLLIGIAIGLVAGFICVASIAVVGLLLFSSTWKGFVDYGPVVISTSTPTVTPSVTPTAIPAAGPYTFTGLIYTSAYPGSPDNSLPMDYQLTDVNEQYLLTGSLKSITGFFLTSTTDLQQYYGKCVSINGDIPSSWKEAAKIADSYYHSSLTVSSIKLLADTACSSPDILSTSTDAIKGLPTEFTGTIDTAQRPEADIAYDYSLVLTTPWKDTMSSSGVTENVTDITLLPINNEARLMVDKNVSKSVKVKGFFVWGLAETKIFVVQSVTAL